jgi:hypothetical protein
LHNILIELKLFFYFIVYFDVFRQAECEHELELTIEPKPAPCLSDFVALLERIRRYENDRD